MVSTVAQSSKELGSLRLHSPGQNDPDFSPSIQPERPAPSKMPSPSPAPASPQPSVEPDPDSIPEPPVYPSA